MILYKILIFIYEEEDKSLLYHKDNNYKWEGSMKNDSFSMDNNVKQSFLKEFS